MSSSFWSDAYSVLLFALDEIQVALVDLYNAFEEYNDQYIHEALPDYSLWNREYCENHLDTIH